MRSCNDVKNIMELVVWCDRMSKFMHELEFENITMK